MEAVTPPLVRQATARGTLINIPEVVFMLHVVFLQFFFNNWFIFAVLNVILNSNSRVTVSLLFITVWYSFVCVLVKVLAKCLHDSRHSYTRQSNTHTQVYLELVAKIGCKRATHSFNTIVTLLLEYKFKQILRKTTKIYELLKKNNKTTFRKADSRPPGGGLTNYV